MWIVHSASCGCDVFLTLHIYEQQNKREIAVAVVGPVDDVDNSAGVTSGLSRCPLNSPFSATHTLLPATPAAGKARGWRWDNWRSRTSVCGQVERPIHSLPEPSTFVSTRRVDAVRSLHMIPQLIHTSIHDSSGQFIHNDHPTYPHSTQLIHTLIHRMCASVKRVLLVGERGELYTQDRTCPQKSGIYPRLRDPPACRP